jgi:uncharacterized membrane protein YdjX (TVP38/TMEM64 family)
MKLVPFFLTLITPSFAFAAGGYIGPSWIDYVIYPFALAFPLMFVYLGYLSFHVAKPDRRRFVWLYVLDLCLVALAFVTAADLSANENRDWVENLCGLSLLSIPVFTGFISYQLNKSTQGK